MTPHDEIRAVIFDLGGVIVRTEDPGPRVALAQRLGITRAELEQVVFAGEASEQAERGIITPAMAWALVAQQLHLPQNEVHAFEKAFFSGDRADFTLIERIQSLRPAYTTAALSNTWIADLPRYLKEDLHIPDTFDVIISSAQCGMVKPTQEIFLHALAMVGTRPEEAIFVDDFPRNIEAARALGIHPVHFQNTAQAWQEIQSILHR